jgi:hypothetical protein
MKRLISAAGIGGLDRFVSVSMRPIVLWQRARNRPTLRLGHLAARGDVVLRTRTFQPQWPGHDHKSCLEEAQVKT